jgi:hypothetical protein
MTLYLVHCLFRHLATKMRHTNVQGQNNLNQIDAMVNEYDFYSRFFSFYYIGYVCFTRSNRT